MPRKNTGIITLERCHRERTKTSIPAKISRLVDMETPQWVYNESPRASEIRSLKTKQLFELTVRRTRRSMLQHGFLDQRTLDLPCPLSHTSGPWMRV
jgi:hypothetical protein